MMLMMAIITNVGRNVNGPWCYGSLGLLIRVYDVLGTGAWGLD